MNRIHRDPRTGHVTIVSGPDQAPEAPEGWSVLADDEGTPVRADSDVDELGDGATH